MAALDGVVAGCKELDARAGDASTGPVDDAVADDIPRGGLAWGLAVEDDAAAAGFPNLDPFDEDVVAAVEVQRVAGAPICPAATWTFCSLTALTTSSVVIDRASIFLGSNQIRML